MAGQEQEAGSWPGAEAPATGEGCGAGPGKGARGGARAPGLSRGREPGEQAQRRRGLPGALSGRPGSCTSSPRPGADTGAGKRRRCGQEQPGGPSTAPRTGLAEAANPVARGDQGARAWGGGPGVVLGEGRCAGEKERRFMERAGLKKPDRDPPRPPPCSRVPGAAGVTRRGPGLRAKDPVGLVSQEF